jgi:hypothetical protein
MSTAEFVSVPNPVRGIIWINDAVGTRRRRCYEHILRDQADYERIAAYILQNPVNWNKDEENPPIMTGNVPPVRDL